MNPPINHRIPGSARRPGPVGICSFLCPLLLLFFLILLPTCASTVPSSSPCGVQEGYWIETEDAATIYLHHHAASGPPVLVVHGISSNHYCWDLDPRRSLGVFLAQAGLDTWLLDMRGHGLASKGPDARHMKRSWNIDDYALHDIPAAIDFIRQKTGAPRLGYVGHSLGGIVGAIYASQLGDSALYSMVVLGSPVDFSDPDPLLQLARHAFLLGSGMPASVRTPTLARMLDAMADRLPALPEELLYNPQNISREAAMRMMDTVVSPLWAGEMRQFYKILNTGYLISADGTVDYVQAMSSITVPLLVMAGRADRIAPPDRVRPYYLAVSSLERRFVVAGRENGFARDYGHLDLPLGDRAQDEIYPLIAGWLVQHGP